MKIAIVVLLACLALPPLFAQTQAQMQAQTISILPGQTFVLNNNWLKKFEFSSEYPVTVTEGSCTIERTAFGEMKCEEASAIIFQDTRPKILVWAHANVVKITYELPIPDESTKPIYREKTTFSEITPFTSPLFVGILIGIALCLVFFPFRSILRDPYKHQD